MHDGQFEEHSYDSRYHLWLSQVVDSGTSVLYETGYVFNVASEWTYDLAGQVTLLETPGSPPWGGPDE